MKIIDRPRDDILSDVPNTEGVILGNKIEFEGLFPSKTLDLINGSGAFGPSSCKALGPFGINSF